MRSHAFVIGLSAMALASAPTPGADASPAAPSTLMLTSAAFANADRLPTRFTCDGAGVSPPLAWHGVPAGTRSLALLVTDPDAPDPATPQRTWTHWIVYDLPVSATGLPEGVASAALPPGTRLGRNDWGKTAFGGACPPVGRHRYIHTLYALDVMPGDLHAPDRTALEAAMHGHVLAQARLIAYYSRHAAR